MFLKQPTFYVPVIFLLLVRSETNFLWMKNIWNVRNDKQEFYWVKNIYVDINWSVHISQYNVPDENLQSVHCLI